MSSTHQSATSSPGSEDIHKSSRGRLPDIALNKIMELIRSGAFVPGDVLNETELSRQLSMSRGPIREAVRILETRKIVTREAFQRARISILSAKDITEVFEMREALEGMACKLATERMSDEALARLANSAAVLKPEESSFVMGSGSKNFHSIIVSECGNERIQYILNEEVYDLVRFYRWNSPVKPNIPKGRSHEHWQIIRAMQLRESDLAESLMRSHVQNVMRRIVTSDQSR